MIVGPFELQDRQRTLRRFTAHILALTLLLTVSALGARAQVESQTADNRAASGPPTPPHIGIFGGRLGKTPAIPQNPAVTPDCGLAWRQVDSPSVGTSDNYLSGVVALSPNDAWVAGGYANIGGEAGQTIIEHWDGSEWTVAPSPNVGTWWNYLGPLAAISANDIWAIGYYANTGEGARTLTEHWDGAQWSVAPDPIESTSGSILFAVAAISANDVWAVGSAYVSGSGFQVLIEHWDGTQWTIVPNPSTGNAASLYGVAAISPNDVWATGEHNANGRQETLALHWDGSAWSVASSPNNDTGNNTLYRVTAIAANDVWAVGTYATQFGASLTLVEHWDGAQWAIVPSPNPSPLSWHSYNRLFGVTAVSANGVWAVGDYYSERNAYESLIEHWDGAQWTIVPSAEVGSSGSSLEWVSPIPGGGLWAVGYFTNESGATQTLIERYNDPCITPTPSMTSTATSTPTITSTPGAAAMLRGRVDWQGRPAQPNALQQLPITLTLKSGATEINYPPSVTDARGFFTVAMGSLAQGRYSWRVKGPKYLANTGTVILNGAPIISMEIGLMMTVDANDDNTVSATDFTILKATFGVPIGDPNYDDRADFTGDSLVNTVDFVLLKRNFGQGGAPPIYHAEEGRKRSK